MLTNQAKMMQVFSGQARTLATPVVYIDFMGGSHAGGTFLSQLIFWSDKGGKKDGWFYKSYKEWYDEVRLSRHHVNKFAQALVEAGVLETQVRKANGFPTLHYKLDMEKLTIAFCEFLQKGLDDDSDMRKVANPFVNFRKTITEDDLQNTEAENTNYVSIASDEKPSPSTAPESALPITEIHEFVMPLVNSAGALHNATPVVTPAVNTIFAEILPTEPTPIKGKTKKSAALKPSKPPKEPREMSERDLAFLEKITQLNPLIAPDVEKRLGMYRRSNPWSVTQIFLLTGIWPNKNNWNAITSINGVAFDTEKLVTCLDEWTSHGWNPKNLAWVLQWYKFGIPTQYSKNNQQQAVSAPTKPKIESDDPLVMNFAQWIAAKPGYGSKSPYSIKLSAWLATNGDYDVAAQHIGDIEELHADYLAEKG